MGLNMGVIGFACAVNEIVMGLNRAIASRILSLVKRTTLQYPEMKIAMSGGVARNAGVVRAISFLMGREVSVPKNPDTVGALGAALIARERSTAQPGEFAAANGSGWVSSGLQGMKLFAISDIHGATRPIDEAGPLIRAADWVVVAGDITRTKTRAEASDVMARLEQYTTRILAVHGNWDKLEVKDLLEEKGYSLHGKGRLLDGIGFFGLGGSSPTPMHTATEYPEEEIAVLLRRGYEEVHEAPQAVLVSHVPPRGVRDRSFLGLRGGSHSVRAFLQEYPLRLCLCGHIHEAAGIERFQSTVVANAGSFKKGHYLSVEIGTDLVVTPGRVAY